MPTPSRAKACLMMLGFLLSQSLWGQQDNAEQSKVEAILVARCFECHAGENAESGFRLDVSSEVWFAGGESGRAAIVPKQIDRGSLLSWISSKDDSERMPPDGEPLSNDEIETIKRWIAKGANTAAPFRERRKRLWSLKPIQDKFERLPLGALEIGRIENRVDYFVAERLRELGLRLNPLEDRAKLIRRLYLVVLGVPPRPVEVKQFVEDVRPDAYERLVERVLASTEYGEKWAQHWLDIIRFGETHGFETNRERPNAWHFRDYVIESLNADKPYDQFVREQVAGDQLGAPVATGFIVAGPHDIVKSPDINLTLMQRQDELADIVNATGTTFLGLTVGCARCHNHKFDPISQKDFYSMQAIFAGVQHADRAMPLDERQKDEKRILDSRIGALKSRLKRFVAQPSHSLVVVSDQKMGNSKSGIGIRHLVEPAGVGINPVGSKRGYRDDPGSINHAANVSKGQYTWWKNQPGKPLAVYSPKQKGRFRIWLSWGAGHKTHSEDASYELDFDGDLTTQDDRKVIAKVNQIRFADESGGAIGQSLWSGFKNAGVHVLNRSSVIILRGGTTGAAVTADELALERIDLADDGRMNPTKPKLRPPVRSTRNVELLDDVEAKYLRFTIAKSNQSQPCIDELEVFSGKRNVALASQGAKATSGGDFVHPLHKLQHINDGKYGNAKSWIAKAQHGWVQIEFAKIETINRVEWGRDRNGQFADRVALNYRVEVAVEPDHWFLVSSSDDRLAFQPGLPEAVEYDFANYDNASADRGRIWLRELKSLENRLASITEAKVVYAGMFSKPGKTFRLYRGDPFQKREEVEPNTLAVLGNLGLPLAVDEGKRRLEFARWLTRTDNTLLARVIVNRLWQHTFGTGIVATPNDFGNSGRPPTHPKLLDWLASELINSGWSLKHVHRQILQSHTFRQSSQSNNKGMAKDAAGSFLWRFTPRRMEAETIRDSILMVSGVLDHKVGGKGFDGFEIQLENVRHFFPKQEFGPEDWRRMIYMTKVRQERDAVFGAFDCPDASQIISKRSRSTTPLQSLNLLNSSFVLQQSEILAARLNQLGVQQGESPAVLGYLSAFSRQPNSDEQKDAEEFIKEFGLPAFCRALLNSNEFVFIP